MNENESGTPFEDFLRSILGDEAAAEAARALEAQGFDPANLPPEFSDPARMQAALGQLQFLMNTTAGPVNWRVVEDSAKQAAYMSGDQAPTATEAEAARQAMTIADLWLDAVTDFASGPVTRDVWSKVAWVEHTIPTWKRICEPIALNVSRALSSALSEQFGEGGVDSDLPLPDGMAAMLGKTQEMMPRLSAMMFSAQLARALGALAGESFGTYDTGIPLSDTSHAALLPHNVAQFADGLDAPFDEVRQFLAVREAAHRRLFASVPWLEGDLVRAVERYASQIAIDTEAISEAARSVDPSDPASVESALSGGVFALSMTPDQRRALTRLETMLALIEGWVEVVTARATLPYLPHADALREMMRRRRASGGPAEEILGTLMGLQMRPRQARGAAQIFSLVEADGGRDAREALWSHPDMVPSDTELATPDTFLTLRRAAAEEDADIDAALTSLLDGTLGWADGLGPGDEAVAGSSDQEHQSEDTSPDDSDEREAE